MSAETVTVSTPDGEFTADLAYAAGQQNPYDVDIHIQSADPPRQLFKTARA